MINISIVSQIISQIKVLLLQVIQIYRVRESEKSWDKMKTEVKSCGYGYSGKYLRNTEEK